MKVTKDFVRKRVQVPTGVPLLLHFSWYHDGKPRSRVKKIVHYCRYKWHEEEKKERNQCKTDNGENTRFSPSYPYDIQSVIYILLFRHVSLTGK